jgi:hypothetical protein
LVTRSPTLLTGGGFQTGEAGWSFSESHIGEGTGGRRLLLPRGIVRGRCARSFG